MSESRRLLVINAVALGDLAALLTLRPDLAALARDLTAPHAWVTDAGADGAAVTLASAGLWCVSLWLGLGLFAGAATALPGHCGQLARWLARALLPAACYRVVAGAAGLGVLLAPVAAGASGPSPTTPSGSPSASAPSIPAPTWPADPPTLPAPGWPTTGPTTAAGGPAPTGTAPRPDTRPPHAAHPSPPSGSVVVRAGDSLWAIAAAQLGADAAPALIAVTWPLWYAANRIVIGDNPDLIQPGQQLQPPAPTGSPR